MLQKAERRSFQMEKLAAVFADKVHLGFAAARTCVAVLEFVVFFGTNDLHDARFFKTRKIAVNSAWRNRRQLACNVGSLENPVWIFGDKIHDQLTRLRFVFHVSLCSKCLKFTFFLCKLNLQFIRKFKDSKKRELWQVFGDVPQSKKEFPTSLPEIPLLF